ncbi:hypothetical protein FNV43_RR22194 [Rhamnella rubrinervis]|uniref:Uncharacterized protein n=1 Tax=Rhamnella rubrinervis TaxID=2594499 RepID=A0A8K0DPR8_9ROSA|nr:hypothetical protein FNV43_RR22194 [Rhamnella rubrinervis]
MNNIFHVKVVSKESIKPSAPTPDCLRHYQLSYLDQSAPSAFMPIIFFYPSNEAQTNLTVKKLCNHVKNSLSQVLTYFYPLSGRVKHWLCVDCNDEGACYVEAQANCSLFNILPDPSPNDMNKLLPLELHDVSNGFPLIVQVTFFQCGGLSIGVGLNHEIADALSLSIFINTWSAIARGESDFQTPIFGASKFFPPKDMSGFASQVPAVNDNTKHVAKRFVFDAKKIQLLRDQYSNTEAVESPRRLTRVEAVSTFIWNRFIVATHPKGIDKDKIYTVMQAVNIRNRVEPRLPENYFGNISGAIPSFPSMETNKDGYYNIVSGMRDALMKINPESLKKVQEIDDRLNFLSQHSMQVKNGEVIFLLFTSLCWFPFYEVDFGWGKPACVSSARLTTRNYVAFLDTKSGGGIEAWVNLMEEDMALFEADQEVLSMFPLAT